MEIQNIIKGHINEFLAINPKLVEERLNICKHCAIFKIKNYGMVCDSNLFVNPIDNSVSKIYKPGYYKGCGCRLSAKTTLKTSVCPANKW